MCMKRDFGFTFANLFDTMFAARLVGRKADGGCAVRTERADGVTSMSASAMAR